MNGNDRDKTAAAEEAPFWRRKTLEELTPEEWEALCDHCGRCCLVKLEDEDTGEIHFTSAVCALYDLECGGCTAYERRAERMPDCVPLTPEKVRTLPWLPSTCAYRLLVEGKDLPDWHPLVSGDPSSVRRAGVSILGRVCSERDVEVDDLPALICRWPA